jgi:hypothetical protein
MGAVIHLFRSTTMSESVYLTKDTALQEFLEGLDLPEELMLHRERKDELLAHPDNGLKFFKGLKSLEELAVNGEPGEVLVRMGKHHLRLRQLLYDVAIAGAGIIIISAGGVHVTWGVVGPRLLSIGTTLYDSLKELDEAEVQVCNAIAHIQKNAVGPGGAIKIRPGIPIGTEEDIEHWFDARGDMVPEGLPDILDRLLRRKVIEKQVLKGKTVYTMIW